MFHSGVRGEYRTSPRISGSSAVTGTVMKIPDERPRSVTL
jgi:hypothetical protein